MLAISNSFVPTVAVVGLERTLYEISEDVGVVEVCVTVYEPNETCPISFSFDVSLTSRLDSAGNWQLYVVSYS